MTYKVLDNNTLRIGTAKEILGEIVRDTKQVEDIKGMTAEQYADVLLENAGYYLPKVAIDNLNELTFNTKFDKALKFLSTMPTSGTVIISSGHDS